MSKTRHKYDYNQPGYSSTHKLPNAGSTTRVYCKHYPGAVEWIESHVKGEERIISYRCGDCGKSWIERETVAEDSEWHTIQEGSKQHASSSN
jgi:hypothetical protein